MKTLFVEGNDDVRFWTKHLPEGGLRLKATDGKDRAVGAVQLLMRIARAEARFVGMAIVDLDYEPILREDKPDPEGICRIQYDEGEGRCRDLEVLLVRSEALSKLLTEYPSERWEGRKAERTQWVRDRLAECGAVVGAVHVVARLEEEEKGGGRHVAVADSVPWQDWFDAREISLRDGYLQKVFERPEAGRWRQIHEKLLRERSPWELCNGHDVALMLGCHLEFLCRGKRQFRQRDVQERLRLALDHEDLRRTPTWKKVGSWLREAGILVDKAD